MTDMRSFESAPFPGNDPLEEAPKIEEEVIFEDRAKEREPIEPAQPETQEQESRTTLLDHEGQPICEMVATYGEYQHAQQYAKSQFPGLQQLQARQLLALRLTNAEGKSVDLLALTEVQTGGEKGLSILVKDEVTDRSGFSPQHREVLTDPLNSPVEVGVLLHELGHVKQDEDGFSERIKGAVERSNQINHHRPGAITQDDLHYILQIVPEAERLLTDTEGIPHYFALVDSTRTTEKELDTLSREVEQLDSEIEIVQKAGGFNWLKISSLRRQHKKLSQTKDIVHETWNELRRQTSRLYTSSGLENVVKFATRIEEVDATKRALQWVDRIKQESGIDLDRKTITTDNYGQRVVTDIRTDLAKSLKSYGATAENGCLVPPG